MKENFGNLKGSKILDVGCGDGVLTNMLARQGCQTSGIDYSLEAIRYAQLNSDPCLKIDFRQGSVYALPWTDQTFDIVVSSDVIEHLTDVNKFLEELVRVTRKGGLVVISTPVRFTERPLDEEHVIEWFPDEFVNVISRHMANANFCVSHPVSLMELQQSRYLFKLLMSIYSLLENPFLKSDSRWRYFALQYASWRKL
ncbi:class I SAM-dependent methyltransferase [Nodularia spumigena CS-584]|nr:class I SAM-dependent methyltransferase [Nodularia spumigena]MDB9380723.1 class I SAM-dependent methyltransferase [Nodularia spumigena CS-584]